MTTVDTVKTSGIDGVEPAAPDAGHGHDPHLQHQWDTSEQQFEAAKLGMWLFLATELLLFGGLFCVYAVFRSSNQEIFEYGAQFLDTRWGLINTAVLITSSLTMAIGVTAAQTGQHRLLVSMLLATVLGAAFMAIKYIEYHHKFHEGLVWGASFYNAPPWAVEGERQRLADAQSTTWAGGDADPTAAAAAAPHVADLDHAAELWLATCRSCHGVAGEGVAGQGKDIRGSEFVAARSDDEMLKFITAGRVADDPLNTTGVAMPPRGGNPLLKDTDLLDLIALVRTYEGGDGTPGPSGASGASGMAAEEAFWIPASSIPDAPPGPPGLNPYFIDPAAVDTEVEPIPHHAFDAERPANAHLFFSLYFCMTGLHGLHVVAGMIVIGWLAYRAIRREFSPDYFTPVDFGGLYWHVVDIIWIFLFPLLYLI